MATTVAAQGFAPLALVFPSCCIATPGVSIGFHTSVDPEC